jgi:hypothetical protein
VLGVGVNDAIAVPADGPISVAGVKVRRLSTSCLCSSITQDLVFRPLLRGDHHRSTTYQPGAAPSGLNLRDPSFVGAFLSEPDRSLIQLRQCGHQLPP